jgi:hypothetical protein
MKTGIILALGFLILLVGASVLLSDGQMTFFPPGAAFADSSVLRTVSSLGGHGAIPPAFGWFIAGTGAVLLGLKLQEKKWI